MRWFVNSAQPNLQELLNIVLPSLQLETVASVQLPVTCFYWQLATNHCLNRFNANRFWRGWTVKLTDAAADASRWQDFNPAMSVDPNRTLANWTTVDAVAAADGLCSKA